MVKDPERGDMLQTRVKKNHGLDMDCRITRILTIGNPPATKIRVIP